MKIEKNLGTIDRIVRIVAGAGILLLVPLALLGPEYEWAFYGAFGLLPLTFGIVGNCPPYTLLGINTYQGTESCRRGNENGADHRLTCR